MSESLTSAPSELIDAIRKIDKDYFKAYGGGWPELASIALVDAVYSIGARYRTKHKEGVGDKLEKYVKDNAKTPWHNSLKQLASLDEAVLTATMGHSQAAPSSKNRQSKAKSVIQAADAMSTKCGVDSAASIKEFVEADEGNYKTLKRAYTLVIGLGPVTFEYFLMLLGIQGVKADRMITRFVEDATGTKFDSKTVRQLVILAHEELKSEAPYSCDLTRFEHAIWKAARR